MPQTQRLLRLKHVIEKTGISRTHIYNLMKNKRFPSSIKIAEQTVGWVESEVDEWIRNKIADSRGKL